MKKNLKLAVIVVAVMSFVVAGCNKSGGNAGGGSNAAASKPVVLTISHSNSVAMPPLEAMCALAEKELGIKIEFEAVSRNEWDNVIKTRLASKSATDVMIYNCGSLLGPLSPADNFIELSGSTIGRITDSFKEAVTVDGKVYGLPCGFGQVGGILYNKKVYAELGLSVPHTWRDFLANCDKIKNSGRSAIVGTFKDGWTSQVPFLGDHYNVLAVDPSFPRKFEVGEAKYADSPAGLRSWEKLADTTKYYNFDYRSASISDGAELMSTGDGVHYIMLSGSFFNQFMELYPDETNDIGVFGIPGDDPNNHGLTMWQPDAMYFNKNSPNQEALKRFADFITTDAALDAYCSGREYITGVLAVTGYSAKGNRIAAVDDMEGYINSGKTASALEYQTPVKGANAPNICAECGSGQTTAIESARIYDDDCKKQAIQLGLNWK